MRVDKTQLTNYLHIFLSTASFFLLCIMLINKLPKISPNQKLTQTYFRWNAPRNTAGST